CYLVWICCILGLTISPIFGQEAESFNPDEVIQRFLEKAEADSKYIGDNYTHYEREHTTDFKDGVAHKKREEHYFVEKKLGQEKPGLYKTLMLLNGSPPKKQRVEFKEESFSISKKFLSRYDFAFIGEETVGVASCWLFEFKGKPGYPEEKKQDRVLNNLEGRVWIEIETHSFKKLVFNLADDVDFASPGFMGAKVNKVDGVVEATTIEGQFAVSFAEVEYRYSARAFFFPIDGHSKKTIYYEKYERRNEQ
ncbi:MAG: hypothetical protein WD898_01735, partial [Candidatus Paceibacterota bacterium]